MQRLPGEARVFWLRALAAEAHGDLAEAERAAAWVLRLDRANPWAWVHAGELYLRIGRIDLAATAAAGALERDPTLAEAHRLSGRAALAAGRPQQAVEALGRAQALHPELDVDADLVRALIAAGDRVAAEARFTAWVPRDEDQLEAAALALELGRPGDALERARSRLDHPTHGPEAAALALEAGLRSCDLADLHRWADARRSLVVEPQWRPALTRIAAAAGDRALSEQLLRADPDPEPYGSLLVDQGRYDEALSWLGDAAAPEVRGRIRAARGEAPEVAYAEVAPPRRAALLADAALARGELDLVLALTDGWSEPSLGWVRAGALAVSGRAAEAVASARASADDPVDADLREAQVRALVGDLAGQRTALEAALAHDRCSVAANVELARISAPCAAADHLARAVAVRVADPELGLRHSTAVEACAKLGGH